MKRKLIELLAIVLILMFTGCSNQNSANEESSDIANETLSNAVNEGSLEEEGGSEIASDSGVNEMQDNTKEVEDNIMKVQIGESTFTATLVDNSTTKALKEMLLKGSLTIEMRDYGNMEKVGMIGGSLPRNDEQITAESGDLILYQGNSLVIYYDTNSWNFTRIGKINNVAQAELKKALGSGNVTVILSLD